MFPLLLELINLNTRLTLASLRSNKSVLVGKNYTNTVTVFCNCFLEHFKKHTKIIYEMLFSSDLDDKTYYNSVIHIGKLMVLQK